MLRFAGPALVLAGGPPLLPCLGAALQLALGRVELNLGQLGQGGVLLDLLLVDHRVVDLEQLGLRGVRLHEVVLVGLEGLQLGAGVVELLLAVGELLLLLLVLRLGRGHLGLHRLLLRHHLLLGLRRGAAGLLLGLGLGRRGRLRLRLRRGGLLGGSLGLHLRLLHGRLLGRLLGRGLLHLGLLLLQLVAGDVEGHLRLPLAAVAVLVLREVLVELISRLELGVRRVGKALAVARRLLVVRVVRRERRAEELLVRARVQRRREVRLGLVGRSRGRALDADGPCAQGRRDQQCGAERNHGAELHQSTLEMDVGDGRGPIRLPWFA
mmetsp:Transcript_8356/g.22371  ORF Transcript_8356/g.22371 Transcript_8356/m.22371 type:complete len:324 (+) Transcript_8356:232-1203(+)